MYNIAISFCIKVLNTSIQPYTMKLLQFKLFYSSSYIMSYVVQEFRNDMLETQWCQAMLNKQDFLQNDFENGCEKFAPKICLHSHKNAINETLQTKSLRIDVPIKRIIEKLKIVE